MFNRIAFIITGIMTIGIGIEIFVTGGYFSRYGFFSDYSQFNVLVGVILSILGISMILVALWRKRK